MYLYKLTLENNSNYNEIKYEDGMYQNNNYVPLQIDNAK